MRPRIPAAVLAGVLALGALAGCSGDDSSTPLGAESSVADGSAVAPSTIADYAELVSEMAPLAAPLGWEVQRAYRQEAYLVGRDVELVNVYLRPVGAEPTPEQYLADATAAMRVIASHVFAADATVTAIDVCLQRANDEPPETDVAPAIRMLGLREDLAPLVEAEVQLADLVRISRDRRLVLLLDDYVKQAPAWAAALAGGTTVTTATTVGG